jgi:hypothetical protein
MGRPEDVSLHMAITRYLGECAKYKHLAESTIRRYRITLNHLAATLPSRRHTLVRKTPGMPVATA